MRIKPILSGLCALLAAFCVLPVSKAATPDDSEESAYKASTLAKLFAPAARSQNDEAELAAPGQWFFTTATFTGNRRKPSGRYRPLISAWAHSREQGEEVLELLFGGEFPELEFEQGGRKYWVFAGYPGGMGSDVYRAGQRLTIYLQRVGFASGTPVVMMAMVRPPADGAPSAAPPRMRETPIGSGTRRQLATYANGSARFTYAGRAYSLPLDLSGRHSVQPGFYSYENGVRTALLEYGSGDGNYLLLRVTVPQGAEAPTLVPYLVVGGRITPPLRIDGCVLDLATPNTAAARGKVDCSATNWALSQLEFTAARTASTTVP